MGFLESAPQMERDEDDSCRNCGSEKPYVRVDGDTLCQDCHIVRGGQQPLPTEQSDDSWHDWWSHRNADYSGFYGETRVKMVGGFAAVYDFESDF